METPAPAPRQCGSCKGKGYLIRRRGDRAGAEMCECSRSCERCGGLGYLYQTQEETFSQRVGPRTYELVAPCDCRTLRRKIEAFSRALVPAVVAHADFENYTTQTEEVLRARQVAQSFATGYSRAEPPKGFVLSGPVGTGKTHLLAAVLSHLTLQKGVGAQYVEISLLFATIRRGFQEGRSGGEIIGPLSEVEVVAIDELGKGRGSPFELETLDELIARRYNAGRTTLFATNFSLEREKRTVRTRGYQSTAELTGVPTQPELLREKVGERIYSRICEMCEVVELPQHTADWRYTKHEWGRSPGARRRLSR
jgi:DNA replication protein DnaC